MAVAPRKAGKNGAANATAVDLVAVLVAVTDGGPKIMTIANGGGGAIGGGALDDPERADRRALTDEPGRVGEPGERAPQA